MRIALMITFTLILHSILHIWGQGLESIVSAYEIFFNNGKEKKQINLLCFQWTAYNGSSYKTEIRSADNQQERILLNMY